MNQELNQLLDSVYNLQDMSTDVNSDLEKLIFDIVCLVEKIIDNEDELRALI